MHARTCKSHRTISSPPCLQAAKAERLETAEIGPIDCELSQIALKILEVMLLENSKEYGLEDPWLGIAELTLRMVISICMGFIVKPDQSTDY